MLEKGLYNKTGAEVSAATPASLPPLPHGVPVNRLALARWLVPDPPLPGAAVPFSPFLCDLVEEVWRFFRGRRLQEAEQSLSLALQRPDLPRQPESEAVHLSGMRR